MRRLLRISMLLTVVTVLTWSSAQLPPWPPRSDVTFEELILGPIRHTCAQCGRVVPGYHFFIAVSVPRPAEPTWAQFSLATDDGRVFEQDGVELLPERPYALIGSGTTNFGLPSGRYRVTFEYEGETHVAFIDADMDTTLGPLWRVVVDPTTRGVTISWNEVEGANIYRVGLSVRKTDVIAGVRTVSGTAKFTTDTTVTFTPRDIELSRQHGYDFSIYAYTQDPRVVPQHLQRTYSSYWSGIFGLRDRD